MLKTQNVTIKVVPIKRDSISFSSENPKSDFFSTDDALKLHQAKMQLENDSAELPQFTGKHLIFVNE
ncbi:MULTISPECIES: hypothetical protein [Enterobacteriaceae]|uniref:hypothetical protein n=1 Tax=Enterobacteriaceae TaxID=543 RepID=UPI0011E61BB9|nr:MULTISPECIES: hypothetical protein [Enterobacteriaceae]ECM2965623.1 hypothetical protein [Salmonella enterica subsp. enterica serovar Newport]EEJ6528653.1 hypothetical protein [Salmonella enterica]EFH2748654.1 hypothetical protein [Escherichia coli]MDK1301756.1 hypothetical protein [Cronobacter sakazakii]HDY8739706.1 hypothetical protein [Klebsiella pneumoniae]